MDYKKTGELIRQLRVEKGYTQKQLAEMISISDKAISKWECGAGYPDVGIISLLSDVLQVNLREMLAGEIEKSDIVSGNLRKQAYFICPCCGSINISTGGAQITCCGRPLHPHLPKKAMDNQRLLVEQVEDEWYITSTCPMTKDYYISFLAVVSADRYDMVKLYPQWELSVRMTRRAYSMIVWYSTQDGLLYQL